MAACTRRRRVISTRHELGDGGSGSGVTPVGVYCLCVCLCARVGCVRVPLWILIPFSALLRF